MKSVLSCDASFLSYALSKFGIQQKLVTITVWEKCCDQLWKCVARECSIAAQNRFDIRNQRGRLVLSTKFQRDTWQKVKLPPPAGRHRPTFSHQSSWNLVHRVNRPRWFRIWHPFWATMFRSWAITNLYPTSRVCKKFYSQIISTSNLCPTFSISKNLTHEIFLFQIFTRPLSSTRFNTKNISITNLYPVFPVS